MHRVSNLLHLHFNLEYKNRTLKEINIHLILVNNMTWKIFIKVFIKCRIDLKSFLIILLVVFQNCKKSSKILIFPQNIEFQNTIYKKKSYFALRKFYEKTKDFSFSFFGYEF